jgi:RNA polymerase sigma-70 factor (ECF subfamily)
MTDDDNDLAARANRGDAAAFAALLGRHYDLIYRLALRMLGNQADAEDVAQDICVSLAGKLKSFRGTAKFTTWLYQVTINTTRDFLRRRATIQRIQSEFVEVDELNKAADQDRQKSLQWAYEAMNLLPDDLRETAMLVVAEGLNHGDAAEILEIKETTVSWRMMKVREHLKALADAEAGDGYE